MLIFRALIVLSFGLFVRGAPRIADGETVPISEHPYVVSVQYSDQHVCGGSILNEHWILTAGHCLFDRNVDLFKVAAASSELSQPVLVYSVKSLVIHENYLNGSDKTYAVDNIGMVRVNGEMLFSDVIKPIALPDKDITDYQQSANFVGWGVDDVMKSGMVSGQSPVNELRSVVMGLTTPYYCSYSDANVHICATSRDNVKWICPYDDGGPLVVNDVLVGIALKLRRCDHFTIPYTRVWHYKEWIEYVMKFGTQPGQIPSTESEHTKLIRYKFYITIFMNVTIKRQ